MTAIVSFGAFLVLCVVACKVATRMGDAADELKRRRPMPPVFVERYEGKIPKPLTAAQIKALEERRDYIATHPYKANKYHG